MLTEPNLQELLEYQSHHPVLSVYLNANPTDGSADFHKLRLRSMLKNIELSEDVAAVEKYLDHQYDWSGRSVAIFSCIKDDFFRAYPLAIPIRSRVRVNTSPHVKPLADLWDFYGGYGVVLVDKQGARVFHFHLGELQEQEGLMGESVRRTKRGGSSTVTGRRGGVAGRTNYVEEVVERNMKEAVDFAARFFSENHIRRVLIGGTEDNVALFRSLLPKSWQSLIVGDFPISMTASKDEVLARAMEVGKQAEYRHEAQLLDVILTSAAKKKGGVVQLDDTLHAVHEGRVQTLVVKEGFRESGNQCKSCGYLTAKEISACPFCGGEFLHIPDAVELAVRKVLQQGGEVEMLHIEKIAESFGGIGAILRY